jgi:hypothetical protein
MTTVPAGIALVLACMAAAFAGVLAAALAGRILAPALKALARETYALWRTR